MWKQRYQIESLKYEYFNVNFEELDVFLFYMSNNQFKKQLVVEKRFVNLKRC